MRALKTNVILRRSRRTCGLAMLAQQQTLALKTNVILSAAKDLRFGDDCITTNAGLQNKCHPEAQPKDLRFGDARTTTNAGP